jgi:hypothetical protein
MCFDKEINNYTHKVAEEDIVCYKVVNRCYDSKPRWESFYRHFIYEQGEVYEEKLSDGLLNILDGRPTLNHLVYHSYSDLTGINRFECASVHFTSVVVKCIIPKGTIYWLNSTKKQYASTAIKVVDEEPIYKD